MTEKQGTVLEGIDHVVVLMLENRSFDNVLGWLYDPGNDPPFDQVPAGQTFDGVSGKGLSNPGPRGTVIPVGWTASTTNPFPDPGEEYERVYGQLYNVNPLPDGVAPDKVPPDPPQPPGMLGFVNNYALQRLVPTVWDIVAGFRWGRPRSYGRVLRRLIQFLRKTKVRTPGNIMNGFRPRTLPAFCTLAHAFVVCDRWFASVPSQTLTNRSFMHAGTASGHVNNADGNFPVFINDTTTIYDLLTATGVDWRIYYGGHWFLCNAFLTQEHLLNDMADSVLGQGGHFRPFRTLLEDAAAGTLPAYAFVEPNFIDSEEYGRENDMHPDAGVADVDGLPSDVRFGDELVRRLYQALRHGPKWNKTLLVVTFDEHGGCYDHVPPGPAVPPDDRTIPPGQPGYSGFGFNRYGVRVPAVLISPRLQRGAVDHTVYDHTSVLRSVMERFGVKGDLGQRAANANLLAPPMVPVRTDVPDLTQPVVGDTTVTHDTRLSGIRQTMALAALRRLHPDPRAGLAAPPRMNTKLGAEAALRTLGEQWMRARSGR